MKTFKINSIENWCNMIIVVVFLGLASCDSNKAATNGSTPSMTIHEATFMGDVEAVKAHVVAKTDLNEVDAYGSAPLAIAATFGKTDIAKLLIESGADLNVRSADGSTPLHTSSFLCRVEIVKALLEKGADMTIRNNFGATALESVSGPFQDVKMVYEQLSKNLGPFGLKLDFDYIEKTRPQVAEMLSAKK
ncbi:MAG: ankyrin repeat domain-containing protein [Reichenbachiella sp.]|uniref:ankyrin repeat domain-containing protein n=1 Tax=Reichenbachiella sp. TaxID=2184521 RepID=UPI002966080E|nr:ankyrin repeat domain-containing protein [Reichenbachiella sp.]MDW3211416.1 ankyrin repeat domain-containing protein [Reichenbachiella sp.]